MAARVPGEEGEVRQVELIDDMSHPPGMLVPAMKEHDRASESLRSSGPVR